MAELDPLVAEILLKGDEDFISKLKKVGEDAESNFEKLANAVKNGASQAQALTGALGLIEAAFATATAATIAFIEQQTELSQKTLLLADAFGVTSGQLQEIEATFASAGVKVEQFERFANRLTITIAREWPQIAESIKNYATENDAAQLRVTNAMQKVKDAQNALADNSAERSAQMVRDNIALEQAYVRLQFAARKAASEQVGAMQAVRGAQLSVIAAQQNLAKLEGREPSKAEKENLALAQARQAVDTARKAEADARIAEQEKAATRALKDAQEEQAYADLARKQAKDAREDAEQRAKDEGAVKAAIIARAEAEQHAAKLALTNISSIRDSLDGIVQGNKQVAGSVDLSEVSVANLTRGIIAQAKEHSKAATPGPYETLIQLSKTLSSATEEQISKEQRLAIVNRLAGTSMQALGASASEILYILEHDTNALEHLNAATKALDTEEAKHKLEAFRSSLAQLNLAISVLSQQFAIAISPAFTAFLDYIRESLQKNDGAIHVFIDGLVAIGAGLSYVGGKINDFVAYIAKAFDTTPVAIWKGILVSITVLVAATATAFLAWPLILAGIVLVVGYIADNWDKVKKGAEEAWQAIKDSTIYQFLDGVITRLKQAYEYFKGIFGSAKTLPNNPGSAKSSNNPGTAADVSTGTAALASGGEVHGPGTTTSDSVLARLSRGEFVVKAAAVQAYGTQLFHSLNAMSFPGFAQGGLVPAPARFNGGGSGVGQASSTLNLTIGDRTFAGLKGPKDVIDDLASFAIGRQTSATAGNNPSWFK